MVLNTRGFEYTRFTYGSDIGGGGGGGGGGGERRLKQCRVESVEGDCGGLYKHAWRVNKIWTETEMEPP